jgi:nucleoid-associated protein YgaU
MPSPNSMETPEERAKRLTAEASAKVAAGPKVIGEHTVKEGETLTHVTLKFYGETDKPFWQYLYEFNQGVIGPDMKLMKPGMKLRIPELSPELKAKQKKK